MSRIPKYELIRCSHFSWRISRRDGVWYADGRSNPISAGRHSLGTRDRSEALGLLGHLDEATAIKLGLIARHVSSPTTSKELTLAEGRRVYEEFIGRPRITGGVKESTKKRYRAVFDKFLPWAISQRIEFFHQVDAAVLNLYATYLEGRGYAQKTLLNELTTLKQCVRHLIDDGRLGEGKPINLKLRKAESQRAYCYRAAEVAAMLEHCRKVPGLGWIGDTITALACTGMRIGELSNLKWSDIDFENQRITLADESGHASRHDARRTLKSGRSRSFPINPDLLPVLGQLPKQDEFVFHGPHGGRLKPDYLRRMFIRDVLTPLAAMSPHNGGGQSLIDGRLHSFRHYFISMCATNKIAERVVMEWVGHADSAMTRHYFQLHDEEAKQQMDRLNFLGPKPDVPAGPVSMS